jgi:4-amino-4-deoxy-L-arabinose transferase-like glycosyltransferase
MTAVLIWSALLAVAVQAIFSVPFLSWSLAFQGPGGSVAPAFGGAVAVLAAAVAWRYREALRNCLLRTVDLISGPDQRTWIAGVLIAGIALRAAWFVLFPAEQTSDAATYFNLAAKLARGEAYSVAGTQSFWPPGYPLLLSLLFGVLGAEAWVPFAFNIVLFFAAVIVVFRLAVETAGDFTSRLAIMVLAAWPTYVASAGIASKEILLILLLPLSVWLYVRGVRAQAVSAAALYGAAAGAVLGFGALTQPSIQFFPAVFVIYELAAGGTGKRRLALRAGAVFLAMAAAIAPWTARNYAVLNAFVPISTSGGTNFYRANNPKSTGAYTVRGEKDLSHLGEVEASAEGYRLGMEWIKANPLGFLALSLKKQVLFLGDDSEGIYTTLKKGLGLDGGKYVVLKALANVYWLALWCVLLTALLCYRDWVRAYRQELLLMVLGFLYLYGIHSIFESSSKYHVPAIGFLAIIVAHACAAILAPRAGARAA